ncbi:MAG: class I SAM-dependent methyltransferase [Acetobacteraceae bacterium]
MQTLRWADPVGSDKHFWHRYGGFYRAQLRHLGPVRRVVEFGVLDGASIRWLRALFPAAAITGIDRAAPQPGWPRDGAIRYLVADQADPAAIAGALDAAGPPFDLVIEDGSHLPAHQARCLELGMARLRPGGLYLAEDLHTALPSHPLAGAAPGALHLLVAVERARALGRGLEAAERAALTVPGGFAPAALAALESRIATVALHRRAGLPLACWSCGGTAFDPVALRCACGVGLGLEGADSLTAAVWAA